MTTLTQSQFARHLNVDRAYITRLKQAGRLVMTDDGKVKVAESEVRIAATADPAKDQVAARHAAARSAAADGKKTTKTVAPIDDESDDLPVGGPDYQKARARREEANANLAEIELAERAGALMETAAVRPVLFDAGTTCRVSLEVLPASLAPQLATLNDENAIRQLLEEHIGAALNELCDRLAGVGGGT